jgi:toxin ParE1/3/4
MAEIVWTERASGWLEDIFDYIAQDNPAAAIRTVEAIQNKAMLLAEFPELGYRYEGAGGRDVRILLYGHYRIAYLVDRDGAVTIVGVFHAALNVERYLF